jgi:hypothetical protein
MVIGSLLPLPQVVARSSDFCTLLPSMRPAAMKTRGATTEVATAD